MAFLKLSPSSRCMRISSAYNVLGVEPVARPRTHFSLRDCFCRRRAAISLATKREPSLILEKMLTGIFSNESTMLMERHFKGATNLNIKLLPALFILRYFDD